MSKRVTANELSERQHESVVNIALERHSATQTTRNTQIWVDILYFLQTFGRLDEDRRRTFHEQMATLQLHVRPVVRQDEFLPIRVDATARGPTGTRHALSEHLTRIGHHEFVGGRICSGSGTVGSTLGCGARYKLPAGLATGTHQVTVIVDSLVYAGNPPSPRSATLIASNRVTLTADIEIIPNDAPDTVTTVADPALADAIRDAIDLKVTSHSVESNGKHALDFTVHSGVNTSARASLPCDVAFDVFVQTEDTESLCGMLTLRANYNGGTGIGCTIEPFDDSIVTFILRPSTEAARETIDIFEIWDGELVIENVPVPGPAR